MTVKQRRKAWVIPILSFCGARRNFYLCIRFQNSETERKWQGTVFCLEVQILPHMWTTSLNLNNIFNIKSNSFLNIACFKM
jgi:hypothetical protein